MIVLAQALAPAKVAFAALMLAKDHVDAQQQGDADDPVIGIKAIAQEKVALTYCAHTYDKTTGGVDTHELPE